MRQAKKRKGCEQGGKEENREEKDHQEVKKEA